MADPGPHVIQPSDGRQLPVSPRCSNRNFSPANLFIDLWEHDVSPELIPKVHLLFVSEISATSHSLQDAED